MPMYGYLRLVTLTLMVLISAIGVFSQKIQTTRSIRQATPETEANLVSTGLVISQVYGGAGCGTSGCLKNDYIELYNQGTTAIDVTGWSVQYSSQFGSTWSVTALTSVMIRPGQFYLVAERFDANGGSSIPTPDATGTIDLSPFSGKVALVNSTTALSGSCPVAPTSVVDFLGYSGSASCWEGVSPGPGGGLLTAATRVGVDTDNNTPDFAGMTPRPHSSLSPTAAPVSLTGRLMTSDGRGIPNTTVTIAGGELGPRSTRTSLTGYYRFDGLESATTYVVSVQSRRYSFTNAARPVTLMDDLVSFDFIAEQQ